MSLTLPNRPLLAAGEREAEWGPELIRPWIPMPSWDPETEITASCCDFFETTDYPPRPSSGVGRDALTLSRSSSLSPWVARPEASCFSAYRQLTGARTGGALSTALLFEGGCGAGADAGGCPRRRAGWALQLTNGWSSSCPPRQDMLDRLTLLLCSQELLGHVTGCIAEEASLEYRKFEEPYFVGIPMSTRHSQRWRSWTTSVDIARPRDRAITFVARGARSGAVRSSFRTSGSWPPPCMSLSAFSLKNLQ